MDEYGTFDGGENGSLNIVGGGKDGPSRKITAWAEGGFNVNGPIVVQNEVDGGTTRGIRMWKGDNTGWGIYMSTAGEGKSMNGGATQAIGGISNHAIRFRANDNATNGFIFENTSNKALVGINGNTGVVNLPNGWSLDTSDGQFRLKYNGVQKFVMHTSGKGWIENGLGFANSGSWMYDGNGGRLGIRSIGDWTRGQSGWS